jgi:hypothetical protein
MKKKVWVLIIISMIMVSACGAKPADEVQVVEAEEETVGIAVKDVVFAKALG